MNKRVVVGGIFLAALRAIAKIGASEPPSVALTRASYLDVQVCPPYAPDTVEGDIARMPQPSAAMEQHPLPTILQMSGAGLGFSAGKAHLALA